MTQRLNEPSQLQARETARDQLGAIKGAHKERVAWNTPDAADADYSFVPGRLLWSQDDQGKVDEARGRRSADFDRIGTLQPDPTAAEIANLVVNRLRPRRTKGAAAAVARYRDHGDPALEAMLAIFDDELGEGVVTPDHYLNLANGDGKRCPATEPEETGLTGPWPPEVDPALADAGAGVRVAVIDTGWHPPAGDVPGPTEYLAALVGGEAEPYTPNAPNQRLRLYQGHGTFIAGVIKCRAPQAQITHYRIGDGEAVSETDMAAAIYRALDDQAGPPHIINLSAGCHTRRDHGLKTFQRLWNDRLWNTPETVLIAAAGNDASDLPFYPAARHWAIGVGSLDHRGVGPVSSFSNYGDSSDVYMLGRNHVNAFPIGSYICYEAPNRRDRRKFNNGLARWSGTSFAAPLFAGMVAARLGPNPAQRARKVAWDLVNGADWRQDQVHGWHQIIRVKDADWATNTF
jgi:subtilisin family serine protease